MIYYIFTLIIILVNFLINKTVSKNLLYPPTLYSLVWLIILLLHFIASSFNYMGIQYVSIYSLIIFGIGVCVFTLGGFITSQTLNIKRYENDYLYINKKFLKILMILSTILLPLYAYESYQIVRANSITGDYMRDLRLNLNSGDYTRKYIYGVIFSFFYFFINLYGYLNKDVRFNKEKLAYATILLFIYLLLSTGRTTFLNFFVLILGTISVVKNLKIKYVNYSIITFISLFFLYGFILEKGTNKNASFTDNILTMTENTTIYFIGGISAFDYKMQHGFNDLNGERTFRFPIAIFNKIGITNLNPQKLVEEYVNVPFKTNVYTSYQVYIEDYGVYYIVIVLFIQAFMHVYYFKKSLVKNKFRLQNTYLFGMFLFPLVMTFFQDQFINLIPTWIYTFLIVIVSKKFIYYKKQC